MITLNGNQYKLCIVDTNAVSEIIKHLDSVGTRFFELLNPGKYIPCFSLFTILELRQYKDVYTRFLEMYSIFPCFILKSLDQLFQDELDNYPNPNKVMPILVSCPGELAPNGQKLRDLLDLAYSKPEFQDAERMWGSEKKEILENMLSLVKNYPPKSNKYTLQEIQGFIKIAGFQQIAYRAHEFARHIVDEGHPVEIDAFPSIKMITSVVFYKFYSDHRRALESDPFDILISSAIPYVDAIVTEKHLAEILKKIKRQDDFIKHIEIYRVKDLQKKVG